MSGDCDQQIALGFAPSKVRAAFTTLLVLDARFAQILAHAREKVLARIKLQWWHDQLIAAGGSNAAADPLIGDVIANFGHHDVTFEALAGLTRGWDLLLDPQPFDAEHLAQYARERGERLFEIAAQLVGKPPSDALRAAGAAWALGTFALTCNDRQTADLALGLALGQFASKPQRKLTRALRTFALLAHFIEIDVNSGLDIARLTSVKRRAYEALRFSLLR